MTTLPGRLQWPLAHAKVFTYSHENASEVKSIALVHASDNTRAGSLRNTGVIPATGWEYSYSCRLYGRTCPTWWDETQPSKAHSKTGGPLHIVPKHAVRAQWQHAYKCQACAERTLLEQSYRFALDFWALTCFKVMYLPCSHIYWCTQALPSPFQQHSISTACSRTPSSRSTSACR